MELVATVMMLTAVVTVRALISGRSKMHGSKRDSSNRLLDRLIHLLMQRHHPTTNQTRFKSSSRLAARSFAS